VTFDDFLSRRLADLLRFAVVLGGSRSVGSDLVEAALLYRHAELVPVDDDAAAYPQVRAWIVRAYLSEGMRLGAGVALDLDAPQVISSEELEDWDDLTARFLVSSKLERTSLVLRYVESLSDADIARIVGTRPEGIATYLAHVLDQLQVATPATPGAGEHTEDELRELLDLLGEDADPGVDELRQRIVAQVPAEPEPEPHVEPEPEPELELELERGPDHGVTAPEDRSIAWIDIVDAGELERSHEPNGSNEPGRAESEHLPVSVTRADESDADALAEPGDYELVAVDEFSTEATVRSRKARGATPAATGSAVPRSPPGNAAQKAAAQKSAVQKSAAQKAESKKRPARKAADAAPHRDTSLRAAAVKKARGKAAPAKLDRPDTKRAEPSRSMNRRRNHRVLFVAAGVVVLGVIAALLVVVVGRDFDDSGQKGANGPHSFGDLSSPVAQPLPGTKYLAEYGGTGPTIVQPGPHQPRPGYQLAVGVVCSGEGPVVVGPIAVASCTAPVMGQTDSASIASIQISVPKATKWRVTVVEQPIVDTNGSLANPPDSSLDNPHQAGVIAAAKGKGSSTVPLAESSTPGAKHDLQISLLCQGAGVSFTSVDHAADEKYTHTCFAGWSVEFVVSGATVPGTLNVTAAADTTWTLTVAVI
jgi:DNA-directed RNA polymerase specialized sigma24 family protein